MWMNLDQVPAGQAMYTLAVTNQPVGTPKDDIVYDEVDYVASTRLTAREVVRRANDAGALEGYEDARVIGVVNQSDGYVLIEDPEGDLRA
jgi:hypothetical protein